MNLDPLLELANQRKLNNTVIVTFSDYGYKDVVANWVEGLHRLDIQNYLVVSLDERIQQFLDARDIPNVLLKINFSLGSLWLTRINVFRFLCKNGIDFIHSDTDAVWLRNPIPEYFTGTGCHIVSSQGTTWPIDVHDTQEFVLCCGLFYMQSCRQTIALLDELAVDVPKTGDDQVSLNRILQQKNLKWDTDQASHYYLHFQGRLIKCFINPVTAYSPRTRLSVALLPQHLFQRLHIPGQDAFVKHLFTEKDSESKLDMFSRTGCLFINSREDNTNLAPHTPQQTFPAKRSARRGHNKKRILVYGMQSSGASLFSYFLSQRNHVLGIIDLNNHRLAPALPDDFDIVLKTVITTKWSLQDHIESFCPDKTILFIRDPCTNYYSLIDKVYANKSGMIDDKFRLLDRYFEARKLFDLTIFYEDFLTNHGGTIEQLREIGLDISEDDYMFPRTPREIIEFNVKNSSWCRDNPACEGPSGGWGMGNIHSSDIDLSLSKKPVTPDIIRKVRTLCPALHAFYESHPHLYSMTSKEQDTTRMQYAYPIASRA